MTFADRAYVYDNSVDTVNPLLLFRANDGKLAKRYHALPEWAKNLFPETKAGRDKP
ncbi:MAG: hypothetical protein LBS89_08325 [Zoogloeaceae bacterium]|jgi:predicted ABC-type ATPase|nr:hypothetical protein [Zoogloeaceae bacterium]